MMKAVVLAFCVACVAAATHDCPPAGSKYKPPAQTQCAAGSKVCCKSSMGPFFMCRDAGDGCGDGELVGTKDGKVAGAKPPPPRAEDFDDRDAPLRTQKTTKENNAAEKATGKKLRRSKSMSALDKPKPPPQLKRSMSMDDARGSDGWVVLFASADTAHFLNDWYTYFRDVRAVPKNKIITILEGDSGHNGGAARLNADGGATYWGTKAGGVSDTLYGGRYTGVSLQDMFKKVVSNRGVTHGDPAVACNPRDKECKLFIQQSGHGGTEGSGNSRHYAIDSSGGKRLRVQELSQMAEVAHANGATKIFVNIIACNSGGLIEDLGLWNKDFGGLVTTSPGELTAAQARETQALGKTSAASGLAATGVVTKRLPIAILTAGYPQGAMTGAVNNDYIHNNVPHPTIAGAKITGDVNGDTATAQRDLIAKLMAHKTQDVSKTIAAAKETMEAAQRTAQGGHTQFGFMNLFQGEGNIADGKPSVALP